MAEDMGTVAVLFEVRWFEYSNDDIADEEDPNPGPDCGWYIDATLPDGTGFSIGPDFYGPGCRTVDEALALIEKWARQRGFRFDRPIVTVRVVKSAVTPAADDWLASGAQLPAKAGTTPSVEAR